MMFDSRLELNVDRIAVCVTTILDGAKNLNDTNKYEKRILSRILFTILSLVYINYGIVYAFLGGDITSFFSTIIHGVVFISLGLTDLWFYFHVSKKTRRLPDPSDDKKEKNKA